MRPAAGPNVARSGVARRGCGAASLTGRAPALAVAILCAATLYAAILGAPASAQISAGPARSAEGQLFFKADTMRYDRELGLVVATGNVELTRDTHILLADTVTYNEKADTVSASGNVKLLEPNGEVLFADFIEITGDMKEGVIRDLRVRLQDDSIIAANGGRRTGGNRTEMRRAVYSPCALCEDDPKRAPLWQIKADRVVHDQEAHEIVYNDATLEMYGVPVAYLPYFSHPDPTVERKTGLLAPTFGSDSQLGKILRVPYYFDISPDKDATIEPIITTNEGPVLSGEYRERFGHGIAQLSGSITEGSTDSRRDATRGAIKGMSRFDLDRNWRAGADLYRSTDDTYLRRYGFDSVDHLTSQLYVEGFRGRNYASVRSYAFQGLRVDDDPGLTPVVWPVAQYNYIGEPGRLGQRWTLDASALQLTRGEGTDSRRISFIPGWRLPFTARSGEVITLFATLQTDFYQFEALTDPRFAASPPIDGTAKRIFPQVGVDWRYPFVRHDPHVSEIIEPIVGVVAAPNGGNPFRIPNEDSLDIELQDANVFDANRFTGTDRVEGGQRAYYGLRASAIGQGGGSSSVFLGQSYRLRKDENFPAGSGLEDRLSDYVGRVQVRPAAYLDANYRFRIDKDNFQPKRHEFGVGVGPRALQVALNYIFIEQTPFETAFRTREELQATVLARLTPTWSAGANMLRNLGENGGELRHGFSLIYEDECFAFSTSYARSFAEDRDVRPSSSLLFRLSFKNLGRIQFAQ